MAETIEYKGIFWLPSNPNEQIHGILKYAPEDGVSLNLIEAFQRQQDKFDLILGFTENGKYVTLYNSFETKRGFSLTNCKLDLFMGKTSLVEKKVNNGNMIIKIGGHLQLVINFWDNKNCSI